MDELASNFTATQVTILSVSATLVATLIGGAIGVAGTLVSQRRSAKAETVRWRRDRLLKACEEFVSAALETSFHAASRDISADEVFAFRRLYTPVNLLGPAAIRRAAEGIMNAIHFQMSIQPKPLDAGVREKFSQRLAELTGELVSEYRKLLE